jgi:pimeloyl-ACP methyl ester carboxylesterase
MQVVSTRGNGQYVASETHVIFYNRLDTLDPNARIGIVFAHGFFANGDFFTKDDPTTGPWRQLVDAIVAKGIPIISTDLGGASTWGNETLVSRLDSSITYLNTITGARTDQVLLMGLSMGGTSVLNWAKNWNSTNGGDYANLSKVAGIALFAPAVDIIDINDNNRGGLGSIPQASYTSYPGGWDAHKASANPVNNAAGYTGVPIRIWYSTDDPVCIPSTQTAFASGSGATLTSLGNVGHSALGLNVTQVADWLEQFI